MLNAEYPCDATLILKKLLTVSENLRAPQSLPDLTISHSYRERLSTSLVIPPWYDYSGGWRHDDSTYVIGKVTLKGMLRKEQVST